jgi:flagellin
MIINHNIAALNTHRQMGSAQSAQMNSMEKLSSGMRINSAKDDAAGLSISEKMRGQIRGLEQASSNAQDGISLIQTAEGALSETQDILQRMRELAVQSSNSTLADEDRNAIQEEVDQLATEITRISEDTEFNGKTLLKDTAAFNGSFQIGANSGQSLAVSFTGMSATSLQVNGAAATPAEATEVAVVSGAAGQFLTTGVTADKYTQSSDLEINVNVTASATGEATIKITKDGKEYTANVATNTNDGTATSKFVLSSTTEGFEDVFKAGESIEIAVAADLADGDNVNIKVSGEVADTTGINVSDEASASAAIDQIQSAINTVSAERSKMGATQNRLEHTINNLNTSSENITAAESRIRDVDMAKEMMEQTKNSILGQAAQAMMAQANQQPQAVLQLLR